jgi:CO dehydrogenase nickel-insertion accessory protein CooC1
MVIADLEAGVTDLCWADPKPDNAVVVVTTPDRASLEVARRALQVTADLDVGRVFVAANRVVAGESDGFSDVLQHPTAVEIPEDPVVTQAERRGRSPLDMPFDSAAVQAIGTLASQLVRR